MNPRYDIVIYLSDEWDGFHRKSMITALAKQLLKQSQIMCVDRPIVLFLHNFKYLKRLINWIKGKKRFRKVAPNLFVFSPLAIMHEIASEKTPLLRDANRLLLQSQIRKILKYKEFLGPKIAWTFRPTLNLYIKLAGKSLLVYDIYDDYTLDISERIIRGKQRKELETFRKSDIVFVASENLLQTKKAFAKNIYYVPTGANLDHTYQKNQDTELIERKLKEIKSPRVGYLGRVRNWIDYDLIQYLAVSRPQWSLVFLGSVEKKFDMKRFKKLSNVYFFGYVPYEKSSAYLSKMDVCIIPFLINKLTVNSCPYKLFDYLTAGKAVVSTDLPEVRKFSSVVQIAKNPEEFLEAIEKSLKEKNGAPERIKIARANSWEERASFMISRIEKHLKRTSNPSESVT